MTTLGQDAEEKVSGDRDKILQVLRNLIENALKFTPPGGEVSVAVESASQGMKIIVTNTGQEIPEKDLAYIF